MKYAALFTILMGVVIACFAGIRYATAEGDSADNSFVLGLVFPLICAAALVAMGTWLWLVVEWLLAVPGPASDRNSTGASGG